MTEQLTEAAIIMGIGMSVVFVFLGLLILGVRFVAWLANVFPQPESNAKKSPPKYSQSKHANSAQEVSPAIVAAITGAVNAHRRIKR